MCVFILNYAFSALLHKVSLAAIVASVSPSWTSILAKSAISSTVITEAAKLAIAVTAPVNSSEQHKKYHLTLYHHMRDSLTRIYGKPILFSAVNGEKYVGLGLIPL